MAIEKKTDLGYLGEDFQFKLANAFLGYKDFFKDIHSIVDQNMFTNPQLKIVVGVLKEYFERYEVVPSYSTMGTILNQKATNNIDREMLSTTLEKISSIEMDGVEYAKEIAEKFFKQQNIVKTANKILQIADGGDVSQYEKCVELLNEALTQGTHTEEGANVFDSLEECLSDDYRTPIPTGVGKLDEALEGGLGKGELGMIIGPSSFGKVMPYDEIIMTVDGPKKNQEIKVGDMVLGRDGLPHKVTGVYPHRNWQFYEIGFSDGVSCECGMEHLWDVKDHKKKSKEFKTMSLQEIYDNGIYYGRDKHIHRYEIPMMKIAHFFKVSKTDTFGEVTIKEVGDELLNNGDKVSDKYKKYIWDLTFAVLPIRLRLLQYLLDKNGNCDRHGNIYADFDNFLATQVVRNIVLSIGGIAWVSSLVNGKHRIKFTLFNEVIKPFTSEEKNKKIRYDKKFCRYIDYIRPSRVCDGQCISIDSEDHLYLTRDFIVTHNTSLTTAMCSYAATYKCEANNNQGFKVLQIVFEDRIKQIQRKHIARITNIEAKDLSKIGYIDEVKKKLGEYEDRDMLMNNLRIVKFPSGEVSVSGIKRFVKKLINKGFKPDMMSVDYFECVDHDSDTNGEKEYIQEGKTMRRFEAMASEFDMAIWIPSQGNRESLNAELVTMDKAGGAVKKIQIAHIIMSIARSMEDIDNNIATLALLKNRAGKSGKVWNNVEFNNGTCRISTDNVDEFDNMISYAKKQKDDVAKTTVEIFNSLKSKK